MRWSLSRGWSGVRIALVGAVPCGAATMVGVTWVRRGGDAQTAFTVAAFVLTVGNGELCCFDEGGLWLTVVLALLALLAIVSKIES